MPLQTSPDVHQSDKAARLQLRLLWLVMAFSIALYFGVMEMVPPTQAHENPALINVLLVAAVALVAASFPVKNQFLARLAKSANSAQVHKNALLVALVFCEAAALCGLVAWFTTAWTRSYLLLLVGLAGHLAHYPGRPEQS